MASRACAASFRPVAWVVRYPRIRRSAAASCAGKGVAGTGGGVDKGERGDATAARAPKGSLTPAAQTSNSTEAGCLGEGQECGLDDAKCGSYEIVQVPSDATTVVGSETQLVSPDDEDTSQKLGGERDEQSRAEVCVLRTDGFTGNERVCGNAIEFSSPTTQQNLFYWKTRPCSVLILKKLGPELLPRLYELALWLHSEHGMRVIVEWADFKALHGSLPFLETFAPQVEAASLHRRVDFVLCLGGDGVILHSSQLFAGAAPPVVAFSLGSLGFLANHDFADYARDLTRLIRAAQDGEGVFITLRMRLHCEILRKGKRLPGKVYSVLNEVVVDRGSNPYLSKIECYERGRLITKVQADGVLISTPTVLLPDSAELELRVPDDARDTAWVCFDGKKRQQLQRGDSVTIRMSAHPLPTINKRDQTDDWVASLTEVRTKRNERMKLLECGGGLQA